MLYVWFTIIEPRDGHWGRWSSWGECSSECGKGSKQRTRLCDDPKPKYGGNNCPGDHSQSQECYIKPCGLGKRITFHTCIEIYTWAITALRMLEFL